MAVTLEAIKELRERTGISTMACKRALDETSGNVDEAITLLRKRGEMKAVERAGRSMSQGVVASYVHSNNLVGALVHLGCETDFVARNEDFMHFARDLAMHVTAANPLFVKPEDVPNEVVEKEREIWREQMKDEKKPAAVIEQIMAGKEKKFREEAALLTQPFIKDADHTIGQLVTDLGVKMGENIQVVRFARFGV